MKTFWTRLLTVSLALTVFHTGRAAEEADPVPPPNRPNAALLKERAKNLTPEERQKLIREFREKHGLVGTNRSEWETRREELRKLPPAEREAKLKELRQEIQQGRRQFKLLSPDEREVKRKEMKSRIDAQISELQKQKSESRLNEADQRRLDRMQQLSIRLERGGSDNPKRGQAPGNPPADGNELPPPKSAPNSAPDKQPK